MYRKFIIYPVPSYALIRKVPLTLGYRLSTTAILRRSGGAGQWTRVREEVAYRSYIPSFTAMMKV